MGLNALPRLHPRKGRLQSKAHHGCIKARASASQHYIYTFMHCIDGSKSSSLAHCDALRASFRRKPRNSVPGNLATSAHDPNPSRNCSPSSTSSGSGIYDVSTPNHTTPTTCFKAGLLQQCHLCVAMPWVHNEGLIWYCVAAPLCHLSC